MKLCEQELPGEMLLDLELMFFMSSGINVCNVFFRLKKKSFFVIADGEVLSLPASLRLVR